jgi:hypothetical protein
VTHCDKDEAAALTLVGYVAQIRPCFLHTFPQGWTPKILNSTAFEVTQTVVDICAEAGMSESKMKKYLKITRDRWVDNMTMLSTVRDLTGFHFDKRLCKLPINLMAEVAPGKDRKKPTKLKGPDYKILALVSSP